MKLVKIRNILNAPYLNGAFDEEKIRKVINSLSGENLCIFLSSQSYDKNNEEEDQI